MSNYYGYTEKYLDQWPRMVELETLFPVAGYRAGMWHGAVISEDLKTVVTPSHNVNMNDPIGHLLGIWDSGYVPDPLFESSAGVFGRFLQYSYNRTSDPFADDPFLDQIKGGFTFTGNHLQISHGFTIYTANLDLAKYLLTRLSEIFSRDVYCTSALLARHGRTQAHHLYYSKLYGFSTVRGDQHEQIQQILSGQVLCKASDHHNRQSWITYLASEATYLGFRKDVDLGEFLRKKLSDPEEYFNQKLPWNYSPKYPVISNYLLDQYVG
jgi:hypothetical protein